MFPEEVMLKAGTLRLNRGQPDKERGDNAPSRGIAMSKGVESGTLVPPGNVGKAHWLEHSKQGEGGKKLTFQLAP